MVSSNTCYLQDLANSAGLERNSNILLCAITDVLTEHPFERISENRTNTCKSQVFLFVHIARISE